MAVTTVFQHHLFRLFRKGFASLSALPASHHTLVTTPALRGNGFSFKRSCRIWKFQFQPKVVNCFACKYKHSYSRHNSIYLNLHMHSSDYSTALFRINSSYSVHCSYLNSLVKTTPGFSRSIIRSYHNSSKFTIKNPVYSSYLDSLAAEYEKLNKNQVNINNTELQHQQMLRTNFLRPVVEIIKQIQEKQLEVEELVAVSNGESDQDMKKMLEKEIEKFTEVIEEMEEKLVAVLIGEDPADQSDVVFEVVAGVGGQEAMLFTADILNMYCNYAQYKGWTITGINTEQNEMGGTRKATVELSGQDVYKHMKFEAGVHRVQRIPKTEKAGRVHTSTISVSVMPQAGKIEIDIQPHDLKVETFRGSGPGGQSVNTTDSAVRITHLPTGTVSECRQERSQIKNKEIAMKNLKNKMYQVIIEEQESKRRSTRKMQMGTRSRSEKIRTYNYQQDRVTDHRLKESCSDLTVFVTGGEELDDVIISLVDLEKLQYLESMLEEYEAEVMRTNSGKR